MRLGAAWRQGSLLNGVILEVFARERELRNLWDLSVRFDEDCFDVLRKESVLFCLRLQHDKFLAHSINYKPVVLTLV